MAVAIRGAPKYLEGSSAGEKPRMQVMLVWIKGGVLKKKIWDLETLTVMPEAVEKRFRILLKDRASCSEGNPNSILSSTNCW